VEQWFLCCFHRRGDIGGFEALCRKSEPRLTHPKRRDCGTRIGSCLHVMPTLRLPCAFP
jgi:hypothetical protein